MDFDLTWLLLIPIFFGLGWLAARIDIRHVVRESKALPRTYISGINFLLTGQQDKAVDAFIEAVKLDSQAIDLHFALGDLFRQRGEVERAIKIHQSLFGREDISADERLQASYRLGLDYLKAGLLDRAEVAFNSLRNTALHDKAVEELLEIYQQEREWQKAIDVVRLVPNYESPIRQIETANFYCELAMQEIADSRFDDAVQSLNRALEIHRQSVRAKILLGDAAVLQSQDEVAIEQWKDIEKLNPDYLSHIAEKMLAAYTRQGSPEKGVQRLRAWMEYYPSLDLLDAVFTNELEINGASGAYKLVRNVLHRNPSLQALEKLLDAAALMVGTEERNDIELVKNLIHNHTRNVARYACDSCGFQARQYYWKCPACGQWESFPPRRTEEFNLNP